jgi:hypothetical protein
MMFYARLTVFFAAAVGVAMVAHGQSIKQNSFRLENEETVFSWRDSKCEDEDIPDAPVRAMKDAAGKIVLFKPNYKNRYLIGDSFDTLKVRCDLTYAANQSADPAKFDDWGWIESFYTRDGRSVVGLVSMDYHPKRHGLPCSGKQASEDCWYSAVTEVISHDGGKTFAAIPKQRSIVAGPVGKFDPSISRMRGAFVVSNITKYESWYFAFISVAADPPQRGGNCLFRTSDPFDPHAWRGWDGKDFSVAYVDPYGTSQPQFCEPLQTRSTSIRSLLIYRGHFLIMSLEISRLPNADGKVIVQESTDWIHWSEPRTIASLPIYRPGAGSVGTVAYTYPSLIDPESTSRSFDTVGDEPYLYMTKIHYGEGLDRDLVRFRVNLQAKQ